MSSEETKPDEALVPPEEDAGVVPEVVAAEKSCMGAGMALAGVAVGTLYLTNPTAGLVELIPDNIPLFGNLDEAAATTLLVLGLQYLFGRKR